MFSAGKDLESSPLFSIRQWLAEALRAARGCEAVDLAGLMQILQTGYWVFPSCGQDPLLKQPSRAFLYLQSAQKPVKISLQCVASAK